MSKINTLFQLVKKSPVSIIAATYDHLRMTKLMQCFSDQLFIKITYFIHFGKFCDLKNPRTFSEKLQWLKIHNRKSIMSLKVDKMRAKEFVRQKIGSDIIIQNLGHWKSFDEIEFDKLPNKFVLKCNHDSGSVIICNDKENLDLDKSRRVLEKGLKRNLFYWGREWPYKDVIPCIFAEDLLEDVKDGDLKDYKFFCFNGVVKCFKIDFDRQTNHKANYYNKDGELLDIGEKICPPDFSKELELPSCLKQMIEYAEVLSADEVFVRVDFYEVNGRIYFGELTYYPASGLSPFLDHCTDELLGSWLNLDNLIQNK